MMKEIGGPFVFTYGMHQMHKLPADRWAILIKVHVYNNAGDYNYSSHANYSSYIEGATFCNNSCHGRSNLTIRFHTFQCRGTEEKLINCIKTKAADKCGQDVGIGCSKYTKHDMHTDSYTHKYYCLGAMNPEAANVTHFFPFLFG